MKPALALVLACAAWTTAAAEAHAYQVYCYAPLEKSSSTLERTFGKQCTVYVTRIFHSEDFELLLSDKFNEALPNAGLATCVNDESKTDLQAAWNKLVDSMKSKHCTISLQPPPVDTSSQSTQ